MKYIAILDTDDYEDFEFFEDGNGKYLHAVDAKAENGEWIYLPFKALEQEPIDYKTQYENYLKKSEVVISQLRADRDRLQDAFDKVRAEIERERSFQRAIDEYDIATGLRKALEILDKYKAEIEPPESEK